MRAWCGGPSRPPARSPSPDPGSAPTRPGRPEPGALAAPAGPAGPTVLACSPGDSLSAPSAGGGTAMATVSVRYIVNDVNEAIAFYCQYLGFTEVMHPAPAFAMLSRGDLRLVLSAPSAGPGGGQAMPDGTLPAPAAGIASRSKSPIWTASSDRCGGRAPCSGTRSSREWVAGRSCSRIPPATPSSSSSRPGPRPAFRNRRPDLAHDPVHLMLLCRTDGTGS